MKRNLIIVTLVVFVFSSVFILSSCAKKQVVTGEEEMKAAPKEEAAKAVPEKEKPTVTEAAKEYEPAKEKEKEVAKKEEVKIERLKELEEAKRAAPVEEKIEVEKAAKEEKAPMEEKPPMEEKAVEEKPMVEKKAVMEKAAAPEFDEEGAYRERLAAQVEAESIYFDFDRSFIRPEYRAILGKKFEFLKQFPEYNIRIEGNCDERGTNEYNLALGDRRSHSSKNYLISLGISPDRIETISYGEERPLAMGHNEEAWAQNRRDDFLLMKK
jgi:peptidoglycan-associated lipoprotein